ncbi:hypothetical protein ACILG0_03235 [Pseudomonadota bacterium AL_CKDN230030165-1A_HGKHYDSX7]
MTAPQRKSSPSNVLSGRHVTPARATQGPAPRRHGAATLCLVAVALLAALAALARWLGGLGH